jgi:hypothetical protein
MQRKLVQLMTNDALAWTIVWISLGFVFAGVKKSTAV